MGPTVLPDRERRHLLQFHFVPRLTYGIRFAVAGALILTGFAVQILWPIRPNEMALIWSLPLILIGNCLLLVKGYDLNPKHDLTSGAWEATTLERFAEIPRMERDTRRWDETFADITCVSGFLGLLAVGALVFLVTCGMARDYFLAPWAPVFFCDALALLLPQWITGLRRAWRPLSLTQQVGALADAVAVVQGFTELKCEIRPMLEMTGPGDKRAPVGARIFVSFPDAPKDFLGMQLQVALNNVQGTNYPYLYAVVIAKPSFGLYENNLKDRIETYLSNDTVEAKQEDDVDVIVARQTAGRNSGYHTNRAAIQRITLGTLRGVAQILAEGKRSA